MSKSESAPPADPHFHKIDLGFLKTSEVQLGELTIPALESIHVPRTWQAVRDILVGGEIVDNVKRFAFGAPSALILTKLSTVFPESANATLSFQVTASIWGIATFVNIAMAGNRIMEPGMTKSEAARQKKRLEKIERLKTNLIAGIQPRAEILFEKSVKNKRMTIESERIYSGKPVGKERIAEVNIHFVPAADAEGDRVLLEFRPLLEPAEVIDTPFGDSWTVEFDRQRENGNLTLVSSGSYIDSDELSWDWSKELGEIGRLQWVSRMMKHPSIALDPEMVIH